MSYDKIPVEYRPLSPWAYFGYNILFSLPVIGFILLIIFSLSNSNINRRNYARSFFVIYIIIIIAVTIIGLAGGFTYLIERIK